MQKLRAQLLGHSILGKGQIGLSKQSEKRLKDKIREVTKRNRGMSLEEMLKELRQATGVAQLFSVCKDEKQDGSDRWVDTPQIKMLSIKAMQANDRNSEMDEEVRGRGNPKLANGIKRQKLVAVKQ